MPLLPGAEPFQHDGGPVGVLLAHGFTGSPQSLRPWAEHLAAAGLTVRLPRLPGHGTSVEEMAVTRWEDWFGTVERSFLELREWCDEVFVMGLSMGGTLCIRLAELHGDAVAGLVVVNPSLLSRDPRRHVLPLLRHVLPFTAGLADDIKKPGAHEIGYDRVPLHAAASLAKAWTVTRNELHRLTQPVLVFRSVEDHVVPACTDVVQAGVSSSDVEERLLHDSYHVATLDNDAPQIFAGSLEFVRRLSRVLESPTGPTGPTGASLADAEGDPAATTASGLQET